MGFKEKMNSKKFWIGVGIFTLVFALLSNLFKLWWSYGFEFSAFRKGLPFSDHMLLLVGFQFLEALIIGFLVVFFSFRESKKK